MRGRIYETVRKLAERTIGDNTDPVGCTRLKKEEGLDMGCVAWILPGHEMSELKVGLFSNAAAERDIELVWVDEDDYVWSPEGLADAELPDFAISYVCPVHVQKIVEMMGVPVFNASDQIALASDKLRTTEVLWAADVRQPKTVAVPKRESQAWEDEQIEKYMPHIVDFLGGYPIVIKTVLGSQGKGVFLIRDMDEMKQCPALTEPGAVLAQEFIAASSGTDIRVYVVGGKAVGAHGRVGAEGDFRSNISAGGHSEEHESTEAEKDISERAVNALGLSWGAVDLLIDEDGLPLVCEVNSTPQFSGMERPPHLDVAGLYFDYILSII